MSANDSQLAVESATGLPITLTLAGPGARSFAFVIDLHLRFILAIGWWVIGCFATLGGLPIAGSGLDTDSLPYIFGVVVPAFLFYFLYHPVIEVAMHGCTPGKRIAGVRIVTRAGLSPGIGALLIRNVFRLVDSLPGVYCVGLISTFVTADSVRIGDLAAGTVLVYDRADGRSSKHDFAPELTSGKVAPQLAELIDDLLTRWPSLDRPTRMQLGQKLLQCVDPAAALPEKDKQLRQRLRECLQ